MRRWILPQLLFGFLGAGIGLVHALAKNWGGPQGLWQAVMEGKGALPAARIGPEILVFLLGILFAAVLVALFLFTLNGLMGAFVGGLGGLVFAGLYDLASKKAPRIKRIAGVGSLLALVFSVFASFQMPLNEAAGIFCVTGFFLYCAGWVVGALVHLIRPST